MTGRELREKFVNIAQGQVDLGSALRGGEKFWRWFGFSSWQNWCACFVSWCADQAGISDVLVPHSSGCGENGCRWFGRMGRYVGRLKYTDPAPDYVPDVGDIIYFYWGNNNGNPDDLDNGHDHVGIVREVRGNTIITCEGNSGDYPGNMRNREVAVGSNLIWGFGIPDYEGYCQENKVYTVQGDTLAYVADKYGITVDALAAENGLTAGQALTVGQTLKIPSAQDPETQDPETQDPGTQDPGTQEPGAYNQWVGKVVTDTLNVRTWAGTKYPRIESWPELSEGNLVRVLGEQRAADGDLWYKVEIADEYIGFVHSMWIRAVS